MYLCDKTEGLEKVVHTKVSSCGVGKRKLTNHSNCDEENLFRPDPGIKLTYKEIGARKSVLIGSKLK